MARFRERQIHEHRRGTRLPATLITLVSPDCDCGGCCYCGTTYISPPRLVWFTDPNARVFFKQVKNRTAFSINLVNFPLELRYHGNTILDAGPWRQVGISVAEELENLLARSCDHNFTPSYQDLRRINEAKRDDYDT